MELTKEQKKSYEKLKDRWHKVSEPTPEICGGAAMVQVFYESGGSMWIGIETDGYSHS